MKDFYNIKYYCLLNKTDNIQNPIVGKDLYVRYKGFFRDGDNGILSRSLDKSFLFCDDASELFTMDSGYISFTLNLPYSITYYLNL